MNLITRPYARVSLRGRDLGNTPLLRREIPAGDVVLRLRAEGTGPPRTLRFRAAPGEVVSRSIDLR